MKIYKNFKDKSELNDYEKTLKTFGILFKESEDREDWYELTKDLSFNDNYKIIYYKSNSTDLNIVSSFSKDSTSLTPLNFDFHLLEIENIPEGMTSDGFWAFDEDEEILYKREMTQSETLIKNKYQQKSLLESAYEEITPLNYARDLDLASEDDLERLQILKEYVVNLSRVDVTLKDPTWPIQGG